MATEEQLQNSVHLCNLFGATENNRACQRLTISDRVVSKLSFYIKKVGNPNGDLIYTIRKVSDDAIINSKVWGNANTLPAAFAWVEATFAVPVNVNEEVRICVEFYNGSSGNEVGCSGETSDVKGGEYFQWYDWPVWETPAAWDFAYIYTYGEDGEEPAVGHSPWTLDTRPHKRMNFYPTLKLG